MIISRLCPRASLWEQGDKKNARSKGKEWGVGASDSGVHMKGQLEGHVFLMASLSICKSDYVTPLLIVLLGIPNHTVNKL